MEWSIPSIAIGAFTVGFYSRLRLGFQKQLGNEVTPPKTTTTTKNTPQWPLLAVMLLVHL